MRNYRTTLKSGFTLVEILIVVIILGILAAIVIPQFSNASEDARRNSAQSLIQTIRSAVELYRLEHAGEYPTADGTSAVAQWTDWTKLTTKTNVAGGVPGAGDQSYGPYLQQTPKNPFISDPATTSVVGAAAGAAVGFVWDDANDRMSISYKNADGTWEAK